MKKFFKRYLSVFLAASLSLTVLNIPVSFDKNITAQPIEKEVHENWLNNVKKDTSLVSNIIEEDLYYCDIKEENLLPVSDSTSVANNELIVIFKDGTTVEEKQNIFSLVGATVTGYCKDINQYQLRIEERTLPELALIIASLQKKRSISLATYSFSYQYKEDSIPEDPWQYNGEDYTYGWDESRPNGGNWWLEVTNTLSAWEYEEYFNHITIGIIDGGFDPTHEDLQGKIKFPSPYFEKNNAPDYHGMHVSGIIGAHKNNGKGISGICQNSDLLCVDWFADSEYDQKWISGLRIITAFITLVKNGAKVINMSLGASSAMSKFEYGFAKFLTGIEGAFFSYVMSSLLLRGYDFIVVQSAGNGDLLGNPVDAFINANVCSINSKNCVSFLNGIPKKEVLDRIIVAGSICNSHEDTNFFQSSFSNYGEQVSIFAPGSSLYSCGTDNGYRNLSGTSMAAPVVTGITALVWSVNPELDGTDVKKIICDPENSCYTAVNYFSPELDIPSGNVINAKLSVEDAIRTLGIEPEIKNSESSEMPVVSGSTDIQSIEAFRNEKGE